MATDMNIPDSLIKFNVNQTGFYRVNYPDYIWQRFASRLQTIGPSAVGSLGSLGKLCLLSGKMADIVILVLLYSIAICWERAVLLVVCVCCVMLDADNQLIRSNRPTPENESFLTFRILAFTVLALKGVNKYRKS